MSTLDHLLTGLKAGSTGQETSKKRMYERRYHQSSAPSAQA